MNPVEAAVPGPFTRKRLHAVDAASRARAVATLANALAGEQPGHLYGSRLAQRLSERVGLPVDARVLNGAPVSFLFHVLRGQVLLSRDDDLLGDVMQRTMQRYLDIAPLLRRSAREAFAS